MIARRTTLAAFAALALAPAAARAADLAPADAARVQKATAYLQGLSTVTGTFTQTAPNGATSTGRIWLQRPGKARFQYDPPARMTIVSDGRRVGLWDGRLNTFNTAPLSRTPLNLLLAKQVRLDRGVEIARVDANAEGFALTALDRAHPGDGRMVIYFADAPMALTGWNLTDGRGRSTRVRLGRLTPAAGLDPSLFVVADPRKGVANP
ncbi:MAG: outer membrane lipoprotein carrier protein LolA [Caulobacteraceae bacterium]|nr:outer membrane lipoprotein carrier protein LolA [Caulobacter sp.]